MDRTANKGAMRPPPARGAAYEIALKSINAANIANISEYVAVKSTDSNTSRYANSHCIDKNDDRRDYYINNIITLYRRIVPTKIEQFLSDALAHAKREVPHAVAPIERALRIAKGEVARIPDPPARLSQRQLGQFHAYAKAHPWDAKHNFTASQFIQHHYANWIGTKDALDNWIGATLWREDIAAIEPRLAAAYATEVGRHPNRIVAGLYVRPHKLPANAPRSMSGRRVDELSGDEIEARRAAGRRYKTRHLLRKTTE